MNAAKYIRYILTIATALLFFSACKDDKNESQPTDFILRVDESVSIKLPNSTSYTITTNNSAISYELSGKILTVTAIKEGKATLTVILDSGESHNYSFTISANSYQMGFTIDSTPRIESWISGSTVKTEETAGLQVSCEPGMDITGSPTDKSVRSYGFTYVETGKLLRFSAQGDFSQKGILNNGIMATRDNDNTPIQYEACTVSIEKVNDEVFSKKMMGDGVAIRPANGTVVAPCDGVISVVFEPTYHAIGITMDNQMEVLLHIGLDTVNLKEPIFQCKVKKGQRISCGDVLVTYDENQLKSMNVDNITMCVITSQGQAKDVTFAPEGKVMAGMDDILTYK